MNRFVWMALLGALAPVARAEISLYAEYHLGEAGSLGLNNVPLDSSGNVRNFASPISGNTASVFTTGAFAPGSTAYLSTAGIGNEGWYSTNLFTSLPTDDFAFGIFAMAESTAAPGNGDVFNTGGSTGGIKLSLSGDGWAASMHNVAYIGPVNGVPGSFTPNTWVHLAFIRTAGLTTFYIDRNPIATLANTPVNASPHLSVNPGGATFFDGAMDEARVVTFTPGESTANVLNALQAVPEPGSAALLVGGLGMLLGARRRRLASA